MAKGIAARLDVERCILIVDPDIQKLDSIVHTLPKEWKHLSIGKELSNHLLTSVSTDRAHAAHEWLELTLRKHAPGPVICTDIDIIFHPAFAFDPLAILKQASRHTIIVVLWPGDYQSGILSYAIPTHQHYRFWRNPEEVEIKGVSDALL